MQCTDVSRNFSIRAWVLPCVLSLVFFLHSKSQVDCVGKHYYSMILPAIMVSLAGAEGGSREGSTGKRG